MRARLFFVTYVILLAIVGVIGSHIYRAQTDQSALVREGNAKLTEAQIVQNDLKEKFGIELNSSSQTGSSLDWKTLTKEERHEVQGELAHYLSLVNRVLEIDSKRDITIENRTVLFGARDLAETFQKSGENFEQTFGENYDTKKTQPAISTGLVDSQKSGESAQADPEND